MQVPKQEAIETARENPLPEAYCNIERKRKDPERSSVEGKWDQGVETCLPLAPGHHAWTPHPQQMNNVPRDPGVMRTALTD